MEKFIYNDILLLDNDPEKEYNDKEKENNNIQWGQRKLLLSEILFLTNFWDKDNIPNPIIIYPGGAPGKHIPILSNLFPEFTFHLYDPNKFNIESNSKILIHNKLFTDLDANQW